MSNMHVFMDIHITKYALYNVYTVNLEMKTKAKLQTILICVKR